MNQAAAQTIKKSNFRKFILLTLSRADATPERANIHREEILLRIEKALMCLSIIVAREQHADKQHHHFHIGILLEKGVHRLSAPRTFRKLFPEFDGAQLNITFHRAWTSVCKYVMKSDSDALVWGKQSPKQINDAIKAQESHRKLPDRNQYIIQRMKEFERWEQVYQDPEMVKIIFSAYNPMRAVYEDLKRMGEFERSLEDRMQRYLETNDWPEEYTALELKDKYYLLDWIAVNLLFKRPIKTKQLLLYGEPSTQKTLMFEMLGKVLNIYHAPSRMNDFSGVHDHYDLWVFDEFHIAENDSMEAGLGKAIIAVTNNTLLKVLDGQSCRLDAKYGRLFHKKNNVAIITITNKPPKSLRTRGPLNERFMRLRFTTRIYKLMEERIIATLWGCIQRRLQQMNVTWEQAKSIPIEYNEEEGTIQMQIKNFQPVDKNHIDWNFFGMGDVERHLERGDRAILNTRNEKNIKVTVACNIPVYRVKPIEHIHFNAQVRVQQLCSGEDNHHESEQNEKTLTLLKFAYIPLNRTPNVKKQIQKEPALQWRLRNTFTKQWRPFCFGVITEKSIKDSKAWMKLNEKDVVDGTVWEDENGCEAYYAAWPVQAYIETCKLSNNMAFTYTNGKEEPTEQWFTSARKKKDAESTTYSIIEKKIGLKISGGTKRAYDREISDTRRDIVTVEYWEDEDDD